MSGSRGSAGLAGGLVLVVAVLVAAAALRGPVPLPVLAHFDEAGVRVAVVQGTWAVLVPPVLVAVVAGVRATGRLPRSAGVWALGAASPIVLFLVARANGVADTAALVLVYAATAGGVLLRAVQRPGGDPAPIRWAAVLGIVPWGVVAFTQIGGALAGRPVPPGVSALTLVVLAASIAEWVSAYRRRDRPTVTVLDLVLVALPAVALAVLLIALVP